MKVVIKLSGKQVAFSISVILCSAPSLHLQGCGLLCHTQAGQKGIVSLPEKVSCYGPSSPFIHSPALYNVQHQ